MRSIAKTKRMEHHTDWDKVIGAVFGVICGLFSMLKSTILDISFIDSLLRVAATGLVGGFMGIGGKRVYNWTEGKVKAWWTKKKVKTP